MPRPGPRRLQLTKELSPEQVSLAWEFLASLESPSAMNPEPEWPEPPQELSNLTDSDWFLLDNLLAREMKLKEVSPLQ